LTAAILAVMLALMWLSLRRQRTRPDPVAQTEALLRTRLSRLGFPSRPGEGLLDLLHRLQQEQPELADRAAPIILRLIALRYGRAQASKADLRELRREIGRLKG
ncbi:MAG: DUF4129 domain-containing protein, partial [Gammaproteobacteria bacterium]